MLTISSNGSFIKIISNQYNFMNLANQGSSNLDNLTLITVRFVQKS